MDCCLAVSFVFFFFFFFFFFLWASGGLMFACYVFH